MREYINIHQLDSFNGDITKETFFPVSIDSVTYKIKSEKIFDYVVSNIDFDKPLYNANKLQGVQVNIEDEEDNKVLTYVESEEALELRHIDIDFLLRYSRFRPNKFLKLDDEKNVITGDVDLKEIVVTDDNVANRVIQVDSNGSKLGYANMDDIVLDALENASMDFNQAVQDEQTRAINEEQRLEQLIQDEEDRATAEELRLENLIDKKAGGNNSYNKFNFKITVSANSLNSIVRSDVYDPSSMLEIMINVKVKDPISSSNTYDQWINSEGALTIVQNDNEVLLVNDTEFDLETNVFIVTF